MNLKEALKKCIALGGCNAFVCAIEADLRDLLENIYQTVPVNRERIGICRYSRALFEDLSFFENVFFVRNGSAKVSRRAQKNELSQICKRIGFGLDLNAKVKTLSEVQQYIVELIRTMIRNPEVVILYYSVSVLERSEYQIFRNILNIFYEQGKPVILLTSQWEETIAICRNIIVYNKLKDDYIIMDTQQVQRNPQSVLYAMTGYPDLRRENDYVNTLNTVCGVLGLIEGDNNIEEELKRFCELAKKQLSAQTCVIYIKNNANRISFRSARQDGAALKEDAIDALQRRAETSRLAIQTRDQEGFLAMYEDGEVGANLIVGLAIGLPPNITGAVIFEFKDIGCTQEQLAAIRTVGHAVEDIIRTSQLFNNAIIVQESNHRIKNNFQMMASLLYMKKRTYANLPQGSIPIGELNRILDEVVNQIRINSKLHDMITKHLQQSRVKFANIIDEIIGCYQNANFRFETHIAEGMISYERASIFAMIVNELICNCAKHAFAQGGAVDNCIGVTLKNDGGQIALSVIDNGAPLPQQFDFNTASGMGMSLLRILCRQLNASINFETNDGAWGATATVRFSQSLLDQS